MLFLAVACRRGGIGAENTVQARLEFSGAALPAGRSVVGQATDAINSLLVLFYENGVLLPGLSVWQTPDGNSQASATVTLEIGHDYEVAVFANVSLPAYPQSMEEARSLCYTCDGVGAWSAGIPMSAYKTVHATYPMQPVGFSLVRLASRVDLSIDTSGLQHGSMSFSSVTVRQMNRCCPYFSEGIASAGTGVCDGDIASASDLAGINTTGAGYSTSFYLLENMQGDILQGNANPDYKTPERVAAAGGNPNLCTYLEICGSYSDRSGHLTSEDVIAHLYLGTDAVGNFDLARNRRYTVALTITDNGCLRTDWKIDGNLDDSRVLRFLNDELTIGRNATLAVPLDTNLSLGEGDYSYSVTGDTSFFTVTPTASGFSVSTSFTVSSGMSIVITATSWDGALTTSCTVQASFQNGPRIVVDWENDLYVGQKGTIRIVSMDGNVDPSKINIYDPNFYTRIEGYGYEWDIYALMPGSDVLVVSVGSVVFGQVSVEFVSPIMKFTSDRICLPLDGSVVDCGPYFYKTDGTRMYKSDFDPGLYESHLGFDIVRQHTFRQAGKYWGECGRAGNPAVSVLDRDSQADPCYFRISNTTYRGKTIWENYDFSRGEIDLEKITAVCRNTTSYIREVEAMLYTEDP